MSDIVERLRDRKYFGQEYMRREAADEIQSLRQRVERLEELLEIAVDDHDSHMGKSNVPAHWTNQAREALGGRNG